MAFTKMLAGSAVVMFLVAAPAVWAAPAATSAQAAVAAPTAQELNDKLAAAKKTGAEASTAKDEAVAGKIPDPAQPAEEYKTDPSKRKHVELTDEQRISLFKDATSKCASAIQTVEEVQNANASHPGTIPASAADDALRTLKFQLSQTLVAEVKFRMDKKLGDVASWQQQATEALKAAPANPAAKKLDQELKDLANAKSASAKPATAANLPLGDLSAYKKIVADTQALVKKRDQAGAKARITDLESAWDKAEKHLKPMNQAKWTFLDQSIDQALAQVRSGAPGAAAALKTLMANLNSLDPNP